MPFKIPAPIIGVSISLKPRHFHKQMFRLAVIACLSIVGSARAGDLQFDSGPQRVHVIELFTSQGCSSCPPAEAWLSKLKNEPRLWKDFVPIAFHVDYWDRLGWRDPFASKEWTRRQYQYSENWKNESVYTPGFVLDGRESMTRSVPAASTETPGVLKLSIKDQKGAAEFSNGAANDLDLHIATLGFDLTTKVIAGENSGRNLNQDFVVLSLTTEKMSGNKTEFAFNPHARARAIAAWVTEPGKLEPIQAVGGWLR
jgi:hypothetical protein